MQRKLKDIGPKRTSMPLVIPLDSSFSSHESGKSAQDKHSGHEMSFLFEDDSQLDDLNALTPDSPSKGAFDGFLERVQKMPTEIQCEEWKQEESPVQN